MSRPAERPKRRVRTAEGAWCACEAWRGASGWGVAYFVALDPDEPREDDRLDRRALLEPGAGLADLDDGALASLLEGGAGLTSTERRFADAGGRLWLAQSRGPVWAEGDVASGLTGLVFTSLAGEVERLDLDDVDGGALEPALLAGRLEVVRSSDPDGEPAA